MVESCVTGFFPFIPLRYWKPQEEGHGCPLFFTCRIAAEDFFTATLNGRSLTMPSWVSVYPRSLGSRWERYLSL